MELIITELDNNFPIKIINLKRRTDRKEIIKNILDNLSINNYEFIEAVDGEKLEPSLELNQLFYNNTFNNRTGIIGCALSHYNLWKQLVDDKTNDYYIILEDDFTVLNNFKYKLIQLEEEFKNKDLVFLGYHINNNYRKNYKNIYDIEKNKVIIEKCNKNIYFGGTFSYTINKHGAQKMIEYINLNGINEAIDIVMIKNTNLNIYETQPHLFFSIYYNDDNVDTDIQRNHTTINIESPIIIRNAIIKASNKQTICLNMIVKNEADIIVDTFNNILSYINLDYWVISDTGSTDNTKEVIINYFKEKGIKGELVEHEWRDFGYNRSKALECAYNKTDYLLIFDADDRFYGTFKLPHVLCADNYHLKFGKGFEYNRPLLINNRKQWSFRGVLHEYLSPLNDNTYRSSDNIVGDYYVDSGKFGNRSKNPNKALDDANILKEAYEKELINPTGLANRYAFYCAQSYKDCNENIKSIEWYKKVLTLDTWEQEKYYACLMIGDLYNRIKDEEKSVFYYMKTVVYDSERMEGIVNAMDYYRSTGQHLLVNALYHQFKNYDKNISGYNKLFIDTIKHKDLIEYNNSISAFYTKDKQSGYLCCKQIILNNIVSPVLLVNTMNNIIFYQDFLDQDFLDKENDVEILFNKIDSILDTNNINKIGKNIWQILYDKIQSKQESKKEINLLDTISDTISISNSHIDTIVRELNILHTQKQEFKKAYEIYVSAIAVNENTKDKNFYKLEYEYSLFAFYNGIKNIDKQIITVFNNCEDYNIITNVLSNMKFYKHVLNPEKTINLNLSMNYVFNGISYFFNSSSSCIIPNKTKDGYLLNVRLVNYKYNDKGDYADWGEIPNIVTMNKYIELSNDFEIQYEQLLEPVYASTRSIGIEDIRIFNHKDTIYHIGTVFRPDKKVGICKGIYDIVNNPNLQSDIITAAFNMNSECEKNWVYFNYHDELRIIYNWFPLKICKINDDNHSLLELIEEKPMPNLFKYARGSTCGAEYNNEIWFVIHIVSYETPRHYYHVIVIFDKNMNLLRYSAPFNFEGTCIEYCVGLIVEDSRVIMSYSTMDRTTKIGVYNKKYIDDLLIYR
jgi:GR25 family glycosyltransferase involved in LPS biosynthesis